MTLNKDRLRGALARGYMTETNRHKVLDPDLINAQADEIIKEFSGDLQLAPDDVTAAARKGYADGGKD